MVLVQLYSRPFINATPEDVFYRYAYGSLQVIYLGPSDGDGKRGCICLSLSHHAGRAVIIFLEHGAKNTVEILAAPILRGIVPVIPTFSAEVMPVLSIFGSSKYRWL